MKKKDTNPTVEQLLGTILANQHVILEKLDSERKARERLHKHLGVPIPMPVATSMMHPGMGGTFSAMYRG